MGGGCWRGVANLRESQPSNADVVRTENHLTVKAPPWRWKAPPPPPGGDGGWYWYVGGGCSGAGSVKPADDGVVSVGGVDVRDFAPQELRGAVVGVVPQPHLRARAHLDASSHEHRIDRKAIAARWLFQRQTSAQQFVDSKPVSPPSV